jgi:hypothetical protein
MPFRYLAGKSHEFKQYGWGAADMGRVLDMLYNNMQTLRHDPTLILDQSFMMDIFKQYRKELPPFHEYWEIIFKKKQMKVISRKDGSKVVHYARLLNSLFSPRREADLATTDMVHELGSIAASTIIRELLDQNKATYKYLSVSESEFSHRYSTVERKQSLMGIRATNDEAESVLGGATANIQRYGRISLSGAGAVGDMKRNAFLHRPTKSKSKSKSNSKPLGIFHQFDPSLQEGIIMVAMTDAPATRKRNNEDLERQAKARRIKEELIKEKGLEKATEDYIDALYYYQMYFSPACWKTDPKIVATELKKLTSENMRYSALKENILIRVKGMSWEWCRHAWSKDGKKYSVKELAQHLRWIIKEEKKYDVPSGPSINVPTRTHLQTLGTQTCDVAALDHRYLSDENKFKQRAEKARRERESKGEGSMYSQLQPFSRPELTELIGKRIDVLCSFDINIRKGSKELRWCQGEVLEIVEGARESTVKVKWDAQLDAHGYEEQTITNQRLLPSRWRKDREDGWRMDVAIDIESETDSVSEEEGDGLEDGSDTEGSDDDMSDN